MSKVLQLKTSPDSTRAARVRALLKDRDKAESEIAAILREQLDELGESKWLAWCDKEFGWARRTAYRHLSPTQVEKHRETERERAQIGHIEPEDDGEIVPTANDGLEYADNGAGELAAAERGWYNRAREAAQYARYAPADTCPCNKATIEAIEDAIEAWSSVLDNINRRKVNG